MKSILEIPEIEQEYILFALAPMNYYDRIIDLTNVWIMGVEDQFEKMISQPDQDYLDEYAESDDEWFYLYFQPNEGYDDHPDWGRHFDMRSFTQMRDLRNMLYKSNT